MILSRINKLIDEAVVFHGSRYQDLSKVKVRQRAGDSIEGMTYVTDRPFGLASQHGPFVHILSVKNKDVNRALVDTTFDGGTASSNYYNARIVMTRKGPKNVIKTIRVSDYPGILLSYYLLQLNDCYTIREYLFGDSITLETDLKFYFIDWVTSFWDENLGKDDSLMRVVKEEKKRLSKAVNEKLIRTVLKRILRMANCDDDKEEDFRLAKSKLAKRTGYRKFGRSINK